MTEPIVRVDGESANKNFATNDGKLDAAKGALPPVSVDGLNDPRLAAALEEHNKKTGDQADAARERLGKGKDAANALLQTDKDGASRYRGDRVSGGPQALRNLLSAGGPASSAPAAMPMSAPAAPAPAPQMPPPQMPPPQMPQMPASPQVTPDQLNRLLSGAGITPEIMKKAATSKRSSSSSSSSTGARPTAKGRDPLNPKDVVCRPLDIQMSGSKLDKIMDKALDNNGIPEDRAIRKKWKSLMLFMAMKESSCSVNAVCLDDTNAVGAKREDGHPGQASRGIWQTIPETFAKYHVSGTSNNIYDPVANASASLAYSIARYGVEPTAGPKFEQFYAARRRNGYTGY